MASFDDANTAATSPPSAALGPVAEIGPVGPLSRKLLPFRYLLLVLYALLLAAVFGLVLLENSRGLMNMGMPVGLVAAITGVLLVLQAAFLAGAPHWRWPRPTRRRPIAVSLVAGSLVAALLSAGIILALLSLSAHDLEGDWRAIVFLLIFPLCAWVAWFIAFAFMWAAAPATGFRRVYRTLVAGTCLELLITIPVDVQVRKRTNCYCSEGTFFSMAVGISIALWAFGPGLVLLFLARRVQRRSDLRICLGCGYDLRGLIEPRCPECGLPFDRPLAKVNPTTLAGAGVPAGTAPGEEVKD